MDLGKTQRQLSFALNLDVAQTNRMISGKRGVQLDEVVPLANFLEMPAQEVFERLTGYPLDSGPKNQVLQQFLGRYSDLPEHRLLDFLDNLSRLIDAQLQYKAAQTLPEEESQDQ